MAPKRGVKVTKIVNNLNYDNLKICDATCPICRSILIEPVTLTCNHGFCLSCFENTMAKANLVCPLCRLRIASWYRSAKKENRLVNTNFWEAIKSQFAQQLKNKLEGLDENLDEDVPNIKLSHPGEIRKEYETQKLQDEAELQKNREAEEKASAGLIKKYQEELEYQKAVEEQKIKQDEEIARRLSEQLTKSNTITLKSTGRLPVKNNIIVKKKVGTLDSFLTKAYSKEQSSASIPSTSKQVSNNLNKLDNHCNVMLKEFAKKEYNCVFLSQNKPNEPQPQKFNNISFIKKKSQQLQKLTESDCVSDGSDCIESECRYFKPIEYKCNPKSCGKPAIKVPSTVATPNASVKIKCPSGKNHFEYSCNLSAFVRILSSKLQSVVNPILESPMCQKLEATSKETHPAHSICTNEPKIMLLPKRKKSQNSSGTSPRKKIKLDETPLDFEKISGDFYRKKSKVEESITKLGLLQQSNEFIPKPDIISSNNKVLLTNSQKVNGKINNLNTHSLTSPPLYGFTTTKKLNNLEMLEKDDGLLNTKRLQEKADLEYAKKLQAELNNTYSRYSRRTRSSDNTKGKSNAKSRRQATLDEIITPYKVK